MTDAERIEGDPQIVALLATLSSGDQQVIRVMLRALVRALEIRSEESSKAMREMIARLRRQVTSGARHD